MCRAACALASDDQAQSAGAMKLGDFFDGAFCMTCVPAGRKSAARSFNAESELLGPVKKVLRANLLFSEVNGGCFVLQWTDDPAPIGALATFVPQKPVPPYKLLNEGKSELCRDIGGPNPKRWFEGWIAFIRVAYSFNGTVSLLTNDARKPGARAGHAVATGDHLRVNMGVAGRGCWGRVGSKPLQG